MPDERMTAFAFTERRHIALWLDLLRLEGGNLEVSARNHGLVIPEKHLVKEIERLYREEQDLRRGEAA